MASYSRRSRSAGSQGSICGSMIVGHRRTPDMSFCPSVEPHGRAGRRREWLRRRQIPARGFESSDIEGAGGSQTFDDPLVDRARINACSEIGQRREQAFAPLLHDQFDRLRANALQRGQRVIDGVFANFEGRSRAVDVGRLQP